MLTEMIVISAIFSVSIILYMFFLAHKAVIRKYHIISPIKMKSKLRVFFISDIHNRNVSNKLIHAINGEIDIIIIGGDLTDKRVSKTKTSRNLEKLSKLAKTYFVYGNNDREIGEEELNRLFNLHQIQVISNDSKILEKFPIQLVAVDDSSAGLSNLEKAFKNYSENVPTIFISHAPAMVRKAVATYSPFLCLSGHTHGGQIRFGKWGLQEVGKFKDFESFYQLISNGYGTTLLPLRLGARAECHIITISS